MYWLNVLVELVSGIFITAPSLWFSGKAIVGENKAKFSDALIYTLDELPEALNQLE
jgi:hypothetical protein